MYIGALILSALLSWGTTSSMIGNIIHHSILLRYILGNNEKELLHNSTRVFNTTADLFLLRNSNQKPYLSLYDMIFY